tara:strand:+ start:73 stop:354 length:282 start_codon:yes stop_codon:yes gene_type:complete
MTYIDNPIINQVMQEKDNTYLANQYYEHCSDTGREVAKKYNLKSELYDDFIEYFTELCKESDDGYSLINDKSLIDDWWNDNKEIYETTTPYKN